MKAASIHELSKELKTLDQDQMLKLCLRLAKHKKENKELLSYLIFEAHDEQQFIGGVKEHVDELFLDMNKSTTYLAKKSLRKILRLLNKFIKFSGIKPTEVELRIYYCSKIRESNIPIENSVMLSNLYNREAEKIKTAVSKLHEDLQFDFQEEIEQL